MSKKQAHGFTLIEVLVAMSIFAIAVLGLAIGATSVMRANQTGLNSTLATNLAQDKLEQLKAVTVASLPSCPPPYPGGSFCSDTPTVTGSPVTFTRNWEILANSPVVGVTQIDVQVQWRDYITHTTTVSSAVKQ